MVDFKLLIKVKSFSNQFTIPHLPPPSKYPQVPDKKPQSIAMYCKVYCNSPTKSPRK